jgi:antitoxin (DNA-binding transcriptional repressor) of toxin-antitoxin stability system
VHRRRALIAFGTTVYITRGKEPVAVVEPVAQRGQRQGGSVSHFRQKTTAQARPEECQPGSSESGATRRALGLAV